MKNGKLQIGIIGCGGIANQKHLPSLSQFPDLCELVAFCDIIEERALKAKAEYGADSSKTYIDYKELLADDSIDVVHVLTPNVSHCPITVDSFKAGKHVMCEKPMAASTSDAQKMMDAWKASGKRFTIGYQNRQRSEIQTLHRAAEAGYFGDIYFAKAHAVRRRMVPTWGVFPNKALQGGGPLIDIGTHALDITLWTMNNYEPESVTGSVYWKMADKYEGNVFGPWDPETFETEDSAFGFIKMKNGATIFLESSWALNVTAGREAACTICGTEGGAEIGAQSGMGNAPITFNTAKYGQLMEETISPGGAIAYFEGGSTEPGPMEAKQWLQAVLEDRDALVKPNQAFIVTKILDAIYKSAETGEMVKF